MNITPIDSTSFGILKRHNKTDFGYYTQGVYKNHKIEIYDNKKQKLIYVSDNKTLRWIKSKLFYIQDGIKKIMYSQR